MNEIFKLFHEIMCGFWIPQAESSCLSTFYNNYTLLWHFETRKLTAEGQKLVSEGSDLLRSPNNNFGWGEGGGGWWQPISNLCSWLQNCWNPKVQFPGRGGVLFTTNFLKSTSNFLSPVLSWNFNSRWGGGMGRGMSDEWWPISNSKFKIC